MNSAIRTPILIAVIATLAIGLLAGCAPATGASTAGGIPTPQPSPGTGTGAGSTGKASCGEFTSSSFSGLTSAKVGTAFVAASDGASSIACWYGIGKNAGLTGAALGKATDDTILISTIGVDPAAQYAQVKSTYEIAGPATPVSGVGQKAAYSTVLSTNAAPTLFAMTGKLFCEVQPNIPTSELVHPDSATIAVDEGALCNDAFKAHQ